VRLARVAGSGSAANMHVHHLLLPRSHRHRSHGCQLRVPSCVPVCLVDLIAARSEKTNFTQLGNHHYFHFSIPISISNIDISYQYLISNITSNFNISIRAKENRAAIGTAAMAASCA
jgi:hypothetical protein